MYLWMFCFVCNSTSIKLTFLFFDFWNVVCLIQVRPWRLAWHPPSCTVLAAPSWWPTPAKTTSGLLCSLVQMWNSEYTSSFSFPCSACGMSCLFGIHFIRLPACLRQTRNTFLNLPSLSQVEREGPSYFSQGLFLRRTVAQEIETGCLHTFNSPE